MRIPRLFDDLIRTSERNEEALVVMNEEDRVVYASPAHRAIFADIDFDLAPSFEEIYWHCVETRRFAEQAVYSEPGEWLRRTNKNKAHFRAMDFRRMHKDGTQFLTQHRRFPGVGNFQRRVSYNYTVAHRRSVRSELPPGASLSSRVSMSANGWSHAPAMALLGRGGRPLYANPRMAEVLVPPSPLWFDDDGPVTNESGEAADLREAFQSVSDSQAADAVEFVPLSSRSGFLPIVAVLRRADPVHHQPLCAIAGVNPNVASVVVGLAETTARLVLPGNMLNRLYGMTPAEEHVALGIAGGMTVEDIAAAEQLSNRTVRNRLNLAMKKVGVSRQVELARLLTSLSNHL